MWEIIEKILKEEFEPRAAGEKNEVFIPAPYQT